MTVRGLFIYFLIFPDSFRKRPDLKKNFEGKIDQMSTKVDSVIDLLRKQTASSNVSSGHSSPIPFSNTLKSSRKVSGTFWLQTYIKSIPKRLSYPDICVTT